MGTRSLRLLLVLAAVGIAVLAWLWPSAPETGATADGARPPQPAASRDVVEATPPPERDEALANHAPAPAATRTLRIHGVVRDPYGGAALANLRISVVPAESSPPSPSPSPRAPGVEQPLELEGARSSVLAETGHRGEYEAHIVIAGPARLVVDASVLAARGARDARAIVDVGADETECRVDLLCLREGDALLTGRIVDPTGAPVPAARLAALFPAQEASSPFDSYVPPWNVRGVVALTDGAFHSHARRAGTIDAQRSRYAVPVRLPFHGSVALVLPGALAAEAAVPSAEAAPSPRAEGPDLVLDHERWTAALAALEVRVLRPDGHALPNATVHLLQPRTFCDQTAEDRTLEAGLADGVARFEGLVPGRHVVRVPVRGFAAQALALTLRAGARGVVELRLEPAAKLTVMHDMAEHPRRDPDFDPRLHLRTPAGDRLEVDEAREVTGSMTRWWASDAPHGAVRLACHGHWRDVQVAHGLEVDWPVKDDGRLRVAVGPYPPDSAGRLGALHVELLSPDGAPFRDDVVVRETIGADGLLRFEVTAAQQEAVLRLFEAPGRVREWRVRIGHGDTEVAIPRP